MPPISSLSVAVQGIADFLDGHFGEDVLISVDTPQRANEQSKNAQTHTLNLFVYRVAPSGFHPGTTSEEAQFLRIHVLLTPFLGSQEVQVDDADLRILGHAIRVLQSHPVIPVDSLPGAGVPADGGDDFRNQPHFQYRLQAILQTPPMEELNYVWTTQGGELAYRLSAAYEFALIPIEPLELAPPPVPTTSALLDVAASLDGAAETGLLAFDEETRALPLGATDGTTPPPSTWLPVLLLVDGQQLSNSRQVTAGTGNVEFALAGPPGERVALEVAWVRQDESEETQPAQVFEILTHRVDDAQAVASLALVDAEAGDRATVLTRPVDAGDVPLPTSPFANTLTLDVVAP